MKAKEIIEQIKARAEKATDGELKSTDSPLEWVAKGDVIQSGFGGIVYKRTGKVGGSYWFGGMSKPVEMGTTLDLARTMRKEDADFFAHARKDVLLLCNLLLNGE